MIWVLTGEMSRTELQEKLNVKERAYFSKQYLTPALNMGIIEMTILCKPKSKNQKYRLTKKGLELKKQMDKE